MTTRCYRLPSGAVVQADQPPTPALTNALENLADAARAAFDKDPDRDTTLARQAASRKRNRARLARLGLRPLTSCDEDCPDDCSAGHEGEE